MCSISRKRHKDGLLSFLYCQRPSVIDAELFTVPTAGIIKGIAQLGGKLYSTWARPSRSVEQLCVNMVSINILLVNRATSVPPVPSLKRAPVSGCNYHPNSARIHMRFMMEAPIPDLTSASSLGMRNCAEICKRPQVMCLAQPQVR